MSEQEILELVEKKDYSDAKTLIQNELEQMPQNIEMHKLLGLCNINLGCYDEALNNFNFIIKINPDDALSLYYAASVYVEKNQFEEAETLLNEVIKLRPEYLDAYKTLAVIYLKTQRYEKVFEYGHKILKEDNKDIQIYDILAAAAMENSGFDLAVDYLQKAVDIEPENPKYITKLGIAYFAAGKVTTAIDCYKKSLEYQPGDAQTLYNLGLSFYALEEYKTAYGYLKQAYDNGMDSCLNACALAAYKSGNYKQGIELYTKLTELYPDKDNYKYNLACCYDGANDIYMASTIIERLLTFNLNSLQLKLHLASLYARLGRNEASKVLYADVISLGYTDTDIMYEYAVLCAKTNDTDKAEELFKEIIKINPQYVLAYKDLAIIYTSRRLFDLADEYFKKALKVSPNNIYVLFEYANYYNLMADFEKAKKIYSKLVKLPDVPDYMHLAVAKNYISMNMPQKAKKILFDIFEKNPSDIEIMYHLANVLMLEKDYANARQLLETVYTASPGTEVANMLAKVYLESGEYDKAYNLYKIISISVPGSITIMLAMADCKCRQKDYALALKHLKPVLEFFPEHEDAQRLLEIIKKGE